MQPSDAATKNNSRILLCSMVSKHVSFAFVPKGWVYSNKCCVFAYTGKRLRKAYSGREGERANGLD